MNHRIYVNAVASLLVLSVAAACTIKKQEAPDLTGPSEFGTSVVVSVSPDVLTQDGASQSLVTMTARDAAGQPVRNLSLRGEIRVSGTPVDFGSLSARNVVTGSDGRATLVYTAPPSPAASAGVDEFTIVTIVITPVGTDFNNSQARSASLRLVPPGVIIPPDGLAPSFTVSPSSPAQFETVLFDASASLGGITEYRWSFGDGGSGSGRTATHAYSTPGTYVATLTVVDAFGRTASLTRSIVVSTDSTTVTQSFTFSPTDPLPGQQVNFNASEVKLSSGRQIVSYVWDFGDGSAQVSGVRVSRTYAIAGTYTVTLTVTDDTGHVFSMSKTVPVKIPEALSPSSLAK